MDEETPPIQPIEFPISDLTEEMAQSFQGLAKAQGKRLTLSIQPMLSYTGDEKAIRQLLSILLDNALKYTPEEGEVEIALKKEGRIIRLSVSNTIAPVSYTHLLPAQRKYCCRKRAVKRLHTVNRQKHQSQNRTSQRSRDQHGNAILNNFRIIYKDLHNLFTECNVCNRQYAPTYNG